MVFGAREPDSRETLQMSLRLCRRLCSAGRPGVAPAGDSLSFASPKESKQRKGDPQSGSPSGQPAVLEASGVWLNSLRSDNASPDPLTSALLGPARTGWGQSPDIQSHKYAPRRVLVGFCDLATRMSGRPAALSLSPTPLCAKTSSAREGGSGAQMFERSEFLRTPPALSNAVTRSEAKGLAHPARLSFAYFSLAKQRKVSRLPGRHPACLRQTDVCKKAMTASVCMTAMTSAQPGATPACKHSTNAPQSFPTAPHRRRR